MFIYILMYTYVDLHTNRVSRKDPAGALCDLMNDQEIFLNHLLK